MYKLVEDQPVQVIRLAPTLRLRTSTMVPLSQSTVRSRRGVSGCNAPEKEKMPTYCQGLIGFNHVRQARNMQAALLPS
jgi:hypothetical protein